MATGGNEVCQHLVTKSQPKSVDWERPEDWPPTRRASIPFRHLTEISHFVKAQSAILKKAVIEPGLDRRVRSPTDGPSKKARWQPTKSGGIPGTKA
jgi:hypothetical protein